MVWLAQCRHEVQNITNLNHAIEQYMDVVRMINNEYKGKAMNLTDYLNNNKELYPMAVAVSKAMPQVRKDIAKSFFDRVLNSLKEDLSDDWVIEIKGDLSTRHCFPLRIYKKHWDNSNKLIIGFEFNSGDFYDCYLGVVRFEESVCIKGDIEKSFAEKLSELDYKLKTTQWWLHWEWFKEGDFIDYILNSEETAERELIDKLKCLVDVFELQSGLLSEINDYLQQNA